MMSPLLPLLWMRAKYAIWALRYVPPLIDGAFNEEYQRLSNYITDERIRRFIQDGE